jgi:signal transduction histidine kinase
VLDRFETWAEKAVFLGLLALFLLALAVTVVSVRTQIGKPAPGFVVWQNLVVPAIGTPSWPGSRAGVPLRTVVTAVDGTPVESAPGLRRLVRAVPVGTSLRYTFERNGTRHVVAVPTAILQWRDVLPVYLPYLVDGVAFMATALVVFLFRPRLAAARAGVALGACFGLMLVLACDLFSAAWLDNLYFVVESLTPATVFVFALCFPEPKATVRKRPWLLVLVVVPFVLLAAVQLALHDHWPEQHLAVNDWVYGAIACSGIASALSLVHAVRTSRSARARQQAIVVMVGMLLAALLPGFGILAIILLRLDVPMNWLAPFFLVYPLSIAWAIARHDLFEVERWLRLGVGWAATTGVAFALYGALVVAGERWLGSGDRAPSWLTPLYLLAVLAFATPLRARVQAGVDRLFHREAYSYRATVEATSRVLASVLDADRIATTVLETLTGPMAAAWATLTVLGPPARTHARPSERAAAVHAAFPPDDPTMARLAGGARPLRVDAVAAPDARLVQLGVALVVPIRFERAALGVLLVGEKLSAARYGDDDLDLLQTLANQAALALTNARAADIIRRQQADLAEADRLAAVGEIAAAVAHGIRNPLAGIRMSAEVARADADGDVRESLVDIIAESDRLEQRIRTILDVSRPLAVRVGRHDLGAWTAGFAEAMARRAPDGVVVTADVDPSVGSVPFDPTALGEVLETIVVNAFEAGAPTVTVRAAPVRDGSGGEALVEVVDTGPGMDATTQRRVFELFFTTKRAGTGVGLAMARRLVARQGATIALRSAPGEGTAFTLRLGVTAV